MFGVELVADKDSKAPLEIEKLNVLYVIVKKTG